MLKRVLAILALGVVFSLPLLAQAPARSSAPKLVAIKAGFLVDPETATVKPN
jgi:hypothetical protein